MKNLFLLLLATFALNSCCKNDDAPQPIAEIDKLPPATQTGANTFGCLLNGKAFLPGNYNNATNCFYQYVNGEYYFSFQMNNSNQDNNTVLVGINTNQLEISEGHTYALAGIFTTTNGSVYTGELHITNLDTVNYIVSGTFWFDIEDFQGNIHHITDGRFDSHYTN